MQINQAAISHPLAVPPSGHAGFTLLPSASTGIAFTNSIPEPRHLTNQILLNGAGVAAGDIDGDGLVDLYFCRVGGPNALYRNLGGWRFTNIAAAAGVDCPNLDSTGAAFADLDGDGDLDLIVNSNGGGTRIFLNDGKGHFSMAAQLLNPGKAGMSMALGDVDGDGYLDLYIANYRTSGLMDMPNARADMKKVNGQIYVHRVDGRLTTERDLTNRFVYTPQRGVEELGEVDSFYRSRQGTNFFPVSFTGGDFLDEEGRRLTADPFDWGLSVMFRDINGDGLPDIYVCNDFLSPDRIWINQGNGKFRAIAQNALRKLSRYSMGIDFADINRDGFDDFIVLDMLSREHGQRMTQMTGILPQAALTTELMERPQNGLNTLFLNRGDGTFAEIAQLSGLDASEWSWCPIFLDVDLDGYEDLLVSNGQERAARDLDAIDQLKAMRARKRMSDTEIFQARKIFPRLKTTNLAFRNQHDLTFKEVSHEWGFDLSSVSHGMCLADLDNDGDLDLVVNNLNQEASVYRNESHAPRVAVRLKGEKGNTQGIGSKVLLYNGAVPVQSQEIISGGRYLSSDDAMRVFAAGAAEMRLEVRWRGGRKSVVSGIKPNWLYEIQEAGAIETPAGSRVRKEPVFEDMSRLLQHTHQDEPFDDFERQPTLRQKLSQAGPGISWFDLDGDGREDLIVASGRGGFLAAFRNLGVGAGFARFPGFDLPVTRDQTTLLGWRRPDGTASIIAGSSSYEDGLSLGAAVREYDGAKRRVTDLIPGSDSSTGPLALADLAGDGQLSLFVGGRVLPGRYPEAASSRIFRQTTRGWELDQANSARLEKIGMVSAAVFADLNQDGFPELVLALDWGAPAIFRNDHGKLVPWNPPIKFSSDAPASDGLKTQNSKLKTFADLTGWWNGITAGDFDGDGRLDLAVGNWGRNHRYQAHRSRPLQLYHGDLAGNRSEVMIEAYYDEQSRKIVPENGLEYLARSMPFLRERFPTHRAFAEASVADLLGEKGRQIPVLQAIVLESLVLFNRGDHFEVKPLPVEAQLSPVFAVCVGDYDGDGNEDLFLSQNLFAVNGEMSRCDAGRGLWLRGRGDGGFVAVDGAETGVVAYGEQRGAALCDYDGDGRVDLALGQNRGETRLFHNLGAKPGLRLRVKGPLGNPSGIGTVLRLRYEGEDGPAREIHAGSGYWSQESAVQVMAVRRIPARLEARWPGGRTTVHQVTALTGELMISPDDAAR